MKAPSPMKSMPFWVIMVLSSSAQLCVDAKANRKNVNTPITKVPINMIVSLLAPVALNLTYPILGIVIRFFNAIQIGTINAGKIAGIMNHVLKSRMSLTRIAAANNRMYVPMKISIRPSWWYETKVLFSISFKFTLFNFLSPVNT